MASVKTRVPFKIGPESSIPAEIVTYEGLQTDKEHIAIIIASGDELNNPPLVRIHSECLTGDVFHSSRCDCGEQLDEAMSLMKKDGGIIIYLRQEGRGIGLYNKIEAYKHQIDGMNTFEANNHLGFENDLRDFGEAVQMLKALGICELKLLTNNPEKTKALIQENIAVREVIPTSSFIKEDNLNYLAAKVDVASHNLKLY